MTLQEVCAAIEAETHTRTWAEAAPALRMLVIQGCIEAWISEESSPADAKKVTKVRKPRKAKAAPLTQHAEAVDY